MDTASRACFAYPGRNSMKGPVVTAIKKLEEVRKLQASRAEDHAATTSWKMRRRTLHLSRCGGI